MSSLPQRERVLHGLKNEYEQAIEWLDKALMIFPYMIEAQFNKAMAHQHLGELPNCIRAFWKVLELGGQDDSEVVHAQSMLAFIETGRRQQEGSPARPAMIKTV